MTDELQVGDEIVEAIAIRVAERLRIDLVPSSRMLTAQEVAAQFGLSRAWVYQHAKELGVTRIGNGRRPRLRFDAAEVARRLDPPNDAAKPRRRKRSSQPDGLLPVYGRPPS